MREKITVHTEKSAENAAASDATERRSGFFQDFKSFAGNCIRIRKTTPLSMIDVLSVVSALGVIAATVFWAVV